MCAAIRTITTCRTPREAWSRPVRGRAPFLSRSRRAGWNHSPQLSRKAVQGRSCSGGLNRMAAVIARKDLQQAFEQARALDGSMSKRLNVFVDAVRKNHPDSAAKVDRLVARLNAHKAGESAPRPGDVMPSFVLPDENGRLVVLADLLARGPAIVTFHRGHWCPYCRISINTLARAQARIGALGAGMVAIVPDRQQFTAEMKSDSGVTFPILTDMDNGYAMSLNLAIW